MTTAERKPKQRLRDTPARPGSLEDRMVKRYGRRLGIMLTNGIVLFLTAFLLAFYAVVLVCGGLVLDSAQYVSSTAFTALSVCVILSLLAFVIWLYLTPEEEDYIQSLRRVFLVQASIGVMALIQTFFWAIDPLNPIHEPRSIFLLAVSAALAYFRDEFIGFAQSLIALRTEQSDQLLPFD
ncbi:MAG: hypothetical protein IAE80_02445 [Anaerolinea sp.]|nr:hypothetical protein [Anaerolinea sp.]